MSLREFLESSPFAGYLARCWNGRYYLDFPVKEAAGRKSGDLGGVNAQALLYHVYTELLGIPAALPGRAAKLALWLSTLVRADGLCLTDGGVTDHPAYASTVGDALGTAAFYAEKVGLGGEEKAEVAAALRRIAESHFRIRYPEGAQGKTQQLRFELRVYYWMMLLSGEELWKERFFKLLDNGLTRYTTPAAIDGPLLQPSLNPDWTWNYVCTGGLTEEHSTNTHTPAYYCTEPNGFMFVYLHALRNRVMERRPDFDSFCGKYIAGLLRNLSRGGHLASDLDGYGIHRAWYGPVLSEGIPLESAVLAEKLGANDLAGYCRWYVDRFVGFVKSRPAYEESGLPEAQPFGHRIHIEAQFSQLATARFYASVARALYEFGEVDPMPAVEPPFFGSYAWEAQWLRVSTPVYETSFAGKTCLRNIPVVPCYGDPNLGSLIGGAPLATLFSGGELLYAAGFPVASLWHVELSDHNGRRFVSCSTSPEDETSLAVRCSTGDILTVSDFDPYQAPCNFFLNEGEYLEAVWRREERKYKYSLHVHNRYFADRIELEFGVRHMAGHYMDEVAFILPISELTPEIAMSGVLPSRIEWGKKNRCAISDIRLSGGEGDAVCFVEKPLPVVPGMPGGDNAFSPYPIRQLRIQVRPGVKTQLHRFRCTLRFE